MKHVKSNIDMSYSMFIDGNKPIMQQSKGRNCKKKIKKLRRVEPKTLYHWVEDEQVTSCYDCKTEFPARSFWNGWLSGKHHCRNCGRIFCQECSKYESVLEEIKITKLVEYIKNIKQLAKNAAIAAATNTTDIPATHEKQRVCRSCFFKIQEHNRIKKLISTKRNDVRTSISKGKLLCGAVLQHLDIRDYFSIACLNTQYNKIAMRYFSKFREIQYKPYKARYDSTEKSMLLVNIRYFSSHKVWLTHFIRSVDWNNLLRSTEQRYIKEIKRVLLNRKTCDCWNLMCTRNCKPQLELEDSVLLLTNGGAYNNVELQKILLEPWKRASYEEFSCYITVLLQELPELINLHQIYSSQAIQVILEKCRRSAILSFNVFWELYLYRQGSVNLAFYEKLYNIFYNYLDNDMKIVLTQQKNLVEYFRDIFKNPYTKESMLQCKSYFDQFKKERSEILTKIHKSMCHSKISMKHYNIPVITNVRFDCIDMKFRGTRIKSSKSRPLIIPCIVRDKEGQKFKYEMLYKKDDLRQEKVIMNTIQLMDIILKREEKLDLHITTYNILPINNKEGFIEMISSSKTLYEIQKHNFTIQNYINEQDPDATVREWRTRFVNSCVAHCIISYLLGIGDRHLENMMITNKGCIFHIDYGYILGTDPKFMAPEIRNTPEMIDAMGGYDSIWYEDYKAKCSRAYNCLRRHANLFMMMLSPLYKMRPVISNTGNPFTEEIITEQVIKRFIPNENYQEAKLNFITKVEQSHTSSYKSSYFIDYFHKSKDDIYIFEDEIIEYRKKHEKNKHKKSRTKVQIYLSTDNVNTKLINKTNMLQRSYTEPMTRNNISDKSCDMKIIRERRELSAGSCQNKTNVIENEPEHDIESGTIDLEMRGSPLKFLSVSGLKSSFQSFFT